MRGLPTAARFTDVRTSTMQCQDSNVYRSADTMEHFVEMAVRLHKSNFPRWVQYIADYWSNFCCRQREGRGCIFNALVQREPHKFRIAKFGLKKLETSRCRMLRKIDTLNRCGRDPRAWRTDGHTGRRTDIVIANAALYCIARTIIYRTQHEYTDGTFVVAKPACAKHGKPALSVREFS